MKKKLVSLVLVLCMIVGTCPIFASASAGYILTCVNFSQMGQYTRVDELNGGKISADWLWDEKTCTLTLGGGEINSLYDGIQLNCYHYLDDASLTWDERLVWDDTTVILKKGTTTKISARTGLWGSGTLTIKGEGTLIIEKNSSEYNYGSITAPKIIVDGATVIANYIDQDKLTIKSGSVTIAGKLVSGSQSTSPTGFVDVSSGAYYAKAVAWAVENRVTTGTGGGKFSPENPCTRGQIATFLWNAAGKPEPQSTINPFVDVRPGDYFYKPVLWAVENQITAGTDKTHFSPAKPCTRDQAVTFLWRSEGKPTATNASSFTDVKAGSFYEAAVNWAVDKNVTSGTSKNSFSPGKTCTRGQIVTFLYRTKSE